MAKADLCVIVPTWRLRVMDACAYPLAVAWALGVPDSVLDKVGNRLAAWVVAGIKVYSKAV